MKSKLPKSKSPVDLSDNFKLVKTRKNNKTRMKTMAAVLVMFLVTVLISTFFIPKSKTSIDYQEEFPNGVNENIAPQYGQMSDVNQIVQQKRKDNLLQEPTETPPEPKPDSSIQVNVNIPTPKVERPVEKHVYVVDKQKLGEFFSTPKKSTPTVEDEYQSEVAAKPRSVQSFTPKNAPQPVQQPAPPIQELEQFPPLEENTIAPAAVTPQIIF